MIVWISLVIGCFLSLDNDRQTVKTDFILIRNSKQLVLLTLTMLQMHLVNIAITFIFNYNQKNLKLTDD